MLGRLAFFLCTWYQPLFCWRKISFCLMASRTFLPSPVADTDWTNLYVNTKQISLEGTSVEDVCDDLWRNENSKNQV